LNEFAAFNLEQVRTVYNQGRIAKGMMDGSFADEMAKGYGITLNKEAMRKEGIKRAIALSSVLAAGSAGVTIANRKEGISDEDEEFFKGILL